MYFELCPTFFNPWTIGHQAPLSMGFPRQEYFSGLPFPSPGDIPDLVSKPESSALAGGFLTTEPPGKPHRLWWRNTKGACRVDQEVWSILLSNMWAVWLWSHPDTNSAALGGGGRVLNPYRLFVSLHSGRKAEKLVVKTSQFMRLICAKSVVRRDSWDLNRTIHPENWMEFRGHLVYLFFKPKGQSLNKSWDKPHSQLFLKQCFSQANYYASWGLFAFSEQIHASSPLTC